MQTMMKLGLASVAAMSLGLVSTADAQVRGRVAGPSGSVAGATGPNGGGYIRGRGKTVTSDGSVVRGSSGAIRTPSGGRSARGSTSTVNPDGSATRSSRLAGSGPRGSVASQGSVTRNADGTLSGGRSTTATRNATGVTYSGSTTIDPATGKPVRTATCSNASGAVVPCR